MQSLSVLPPPPGVLGDVSLGLPLGWPLPGVPGVSARLPLPVLLLVPLLPGLGVPPPDRMLGSIGGDRGATPGICGAGVPTAEGGRAEGSVGAGVGEGGGVGTVLRVGPVGARDWAAAPCARAPTARTPAVIATARAWR
jgi:hypothetical protein